MLHSGAAPVMCRLRTFRVSNQCLTHCESSYDWILQVEVTHTLQYTSYTTAAAAHVLVEGSKKCGVYSCDIRSLVARDVGIHSHGQNKTTARHSVFRREAAPKCGLPSYRHKSEQAFQACDFQLATLLCRALAQLREQRAVYEQAQDGRKGLQHVACSVRLAAGSW